MLTKDALKVELQHWKDELDKQQDQLQKETDELKQEVDKLQARKNILERVIQRYHSSSYLEDFKANFYNDLLDEYRDKKQQLEQLEKINDNKINQIEAIIRELGLD